MLTWFAARDLTLDAAQAARSSRISTKTLPAAQIKKLVDSRNDREVLDGLRKVISVRLPHLGKDGLLG
jgi:AP-3 complex subunit beta